MTNLPPEVEKLVPENLSWLKTNTIFLCKHGSHAYGLNTPESDLDLRGVCIPPVEYFFGFNKNFEQWQCHTKDLDITIFDIRKFFSLAAACNPNVVELLFVDESDVLLEKEAMTHIKWVRDAFLSKKAKHTFSGYAHSQLKRLNGHRSWLMNPPTEAPVRVGPEISASNYRLMETLNTEGKLAANLLETFRVEHEYRNKLREWNQYQDWKKTRNPARAALEAEYGYDTKHAAHLVRLLEMCREILADQRLTVRLSGEVASKVRAVKAGSWHYSTLVEYARIMDEVILADLYKASTLRHSVSVDFLDTTCQQVVRFFLEEE